MNRSIPLTTLALALCAPLTAQEEALERVEIPGEFVVCFETEEGGADVISALESFDLQALEPRFQFQGARPLLQWQRRGEELFTNVVLVEYGPLDLDLGRLRKALGRRADVRWTSPHHAVVGDAREIVPNDPRYADQYHHPLMQNAEAWDITLGDASVIIGVTDDGVDTTHEDLAPNIWVNAGEIPGDGLDNDGNGFVDDVNGWDWSTGNSDPNPNGGDDHGTHCAGISAARTDNGLGVAGTAGNSTIMPLQFYGNGAWTAAIIADSFSYGADNGARIITTSYNMNGWVGDPVVTAAYDYIYDAGVLHFNSAGNGNELNPVRQAFHQSFMVASTTNTDGRSSFSNYGTGIDIAAPGSSVLSTELNNTYDLKSGTSMASPNAAGVAALVWAANPGWTRDQVAAQVVGTGDNIDAVNPGFEGLLGGGRVNSFRALTGTPAPARVSRIVGLPDEGAVLLGELGTIELGIDQVLDPATVNGTPAFSLTGAGADGVFGTGDDLTVPLSRDEYLVAANGVTLSVGGPPLGSGLYRFVADGGVLANPFGVAFDGDGDGLAGGDWVRTFEVCVPIVVLEDNAESGADWSVVNESLDSGAWTVPPQVPSGGGARRDPANDFDGSGSCFMTENGSGDTDVDGGPTRLISRAFDLTGISDPHLSFAAWVSSSGGDRMQVDVSVNDGASWTQALDLGNTGGWSIEVVRVADFGTPGAATRLRFSVADSPNNSVTEAGVDFLRVLTFDCGGGGLGTTSCIGAPNSAGAGASIAATGSDVVADNDLTLITTGVPAGQFGLYVMGETLTQMPLGDGFLCLGGTLARLDPVQSASALGVTEAAIDLTQPAAAPLVMAGATLHYQLWYRDAGPGSAGFNLSNALSITWQ